MALWPRPRVQAVLLAAGLALAVLVSGCLSRPARQPKGTRRAATPKNAVLFTPEPYQPDRRTTILFDITFIDQGHGWAVGETDREFPGEGNGILVRTINGGRDWHSYTTRAWPPLFGVSFADVKNGWIVGGQNSRGPEPRPPIWHTTDGGVTWQRQRVEDDVLLRGVRLRDVCAVDSRTAFAVHDSVRVDDPGEVYSTHDGGTTWERAGINRGIPGLTGVSFSDRQNGWTVGSHGDQNGIVLHTSDGGDHWSVQRRTGFELQAVSAGDSRHIWAVGPPGSAIHSSDGGRTWKRRMRIGRLWLSGVRFFDAGHGWIAGSNEKGRRLAMYTNDGGRTWKKFVGGEGMYWAVSPAGRPDVAFGVGIPRRIERIWARK